MHPAHRKEFPRSPHFPSRRLSSRSRPRSRRLLLEPLEDRRQLTVFDVDISPNTSGLNSGSTPYAGDHEVGLAAPNESAQPNSAATGNETASGISYDDVSNLLTLSLAYGSDAGFVDLTGNFADAHIHGPGLVRAPSQTNTDGPILISLVAGGLHTAGSSARTGSFSGSVTLTAAQETQLFDNQLYINIHSSTFSSGEIRGQLIVMPNLDFGDALDSYATLLASNGPRHAVSPLFFGIGVDAEADGLPSEFAADDDIQGKEDFDLTSGIEFTPLHLVPGEAATVSIPVSAPGKVDAFVDWNNDGDFADAGERILDNVDVVAGTNTIPISVPATATGGDDDVTIARFRLSTAGGLTFTGAAADGEVEDFSVDIAAPALDFGDAPSSYATLLANDGARHTATGPTLGTSRDAETDAATPHDGTGDDVTGRIDDEDGVTFGTLTKGTVATFVVDASAAVRLDAFFDFNRDGDFADANENLQNVLLNPGSNNVSIFVPVTATVGSSFARFRISSAGFLTFDGPANDGEVEDYAITIAAGIDFGDAPDSYATTLSANGARHTVSRPFLGTGLDSEVDGQPSAAANEDDAQVTDDEDGVTFDTLLTAGQNATITVVSSDNFAELEGFLDWNGDGNFGTGATIDTGEQVFDSVALNQGSNTLTFTVPANAVAANTFARFRLSFSGGLSFDGAAGQGEVEDYAIAVVAANPVLDFGDAPTTYSTLLANDGPRHQLGAGLFFGNGVDDEADGQPSTFADADDLNGAESFQLASGITFTGELTPGSTVTFSVPVSAAGRLDAFIDWNDDGDFGDTSEKIFDNVAVTTGTNTLTATIPVFATGGADDVTIARFRLSSAGGLSFTGAATDGEVEDFSFDIEPATGCSLVVTTTTDAVSASDAVNSLREAINCANTDPDLSTISFNIPGVGPHTISPLTELPTIFNPVIIDGYTQGSATIDPADDARPNTNPVGMGLNTVLKVELSGASLPAAGGQGLRITAGGSTVRGLAINRFQQTEFPTPGPEDAGNGISLVTNGGNRIEGNFIGTNVAGTAALENAVFGVFVSSANNTIGGTAPALRNLISGNASDGVIVEGSDADGNLVQGNLIGTNIAGTGPLGNGGIGVQLDGVGNTVGGTTAGARNVISANELEGISIENSFGANNTILGNFIGTDVTGTVALGNQSHGINVVRTPGNTIGGTTAAARNLVSGNGVNGILIVGAAATDTVVQGNFIGTDVTGTQRLGNNDLGLMVIDTPSTQIGGTAPGAGNLISGNRNTGLVIQGASATGNILQGNLIGTDLTGTLAVRNGDFGADISAPNTIIGGTVAAARNVISGNGLDGLVFSVGFSSAPTVTAGNVVQGNFIGTQIDGTSPLGNGGAGIFFFTNGAGDSIGGNTIGGSAAGAANVLAFNASDGISMIGTVSPADDGNTFSRNTIHSNDGLGIDLIDDDVTVNDASDADVGPNTLRNFPVLVSAALGGGNLQLSGFASPGSVIELFLAAADPTGFGEGQDFLVELVEGSGVDSDSTAGTYGPGLVNGLNQGTDTTNRFLFTILPPAGVTVGTILTATATDETGNTSEFSGNVTVTELVVCSTVVTNTTDAGAGSLREAINCSNDTPGIQTISFNIPVTDPGLGVNTPGVFTITPASPLPDITDAAILNGTTQTDASCNESGEHDLRIEISGANTGAGANGLVITAGGATVRGLVINLFDGSAILAPSDGNTIQCNYLGTDATGIQARNNDEHGIFIERGSNNLIGGDTALTRNLISGNGGSGVELRENAAGNRVFGNFIGVNVTGNAPLANGEYGVGIYNSQNNMIGDTTATRGTGRGNVISGNLESGVDIDSGAINPGNPSSGNLVRGNVIGLNAAGTQGLGNAEQGVAIINSFDNTIGGDTRNDGNLISRNVLQGVLIVSQNVGTAAETGARNNTVRNNLIGTDITGLLNQGNLGAGVAIIAANNNTVRENIIAFNSQVPGPNETGIEVQSGTGNVFLQNSIFSNPGLGIDLFGGVQEASGVTLNDEDDPDTGANNLQNYPTLTSAITDATTVVSGTFNSLPSRGFLIEFYSNLEADPSGFGEGRTFLGFTVFTTSATGDATINFISPTLVPVGQSITSTASLFEVNSEVLVETSEFSNAITVAAPAPKVADLQLSKTVDDPTPSLGSTVTFTITLTNAGPDPATSVQVKDLVPTGLTNVTFVTSTGSFASGTGIWTVPSLAATAGSNTATLTITAEVAVSNTTLTNTAEVIASGQLDSNSAPNNNDPNEDDQDSVSITIPAASDLELIKIVNDPAAKIGDTVTFTVTLTNEGPDAATNVEVTERLPSGLSNLAFTPSTGDYDPNTNVWSVAALSAAAGSNTATLTITGSLDTADPLNNVAEVTAADQFDPDSTPGNNVPSEDDQFSAGIGLCLTGGPLQIGLNRLIYSCVTPSSISAFVMGTTLGSGTHSPQGVRVTTEVADAEIKAFGIADSNGVAVVFVEVTEEQAGQTLIFQAFEFLPEIRISNTLILGAPEAGLMATTIGTGGPQISVDQLSPLAAAARARWAAAGLPPEKLDALSKLTVSVSDLPSGYIGVSIGNSIILDRDAAGNGWFSDSTPLDDREFSQDSTTGRWQATTTNSQGRIDALTVLMHEFGHALGLPDLPGSVSQNHLMYHRLDTGIRRLPVSHTNWQRREDVNRDGQVSPLDALIIINILNGVSDWNAAGPPLLLSETGEPVPAFPDVNADNQLAPIDVLNVVNYLNQLSGIAISAEGEGAASETVPGGALEDIAWSRAVDAAFAFPDGTWGSSLRRSADSMAHVAREERSSPLVPLTTSTNSEVGQTARRARWIPACAGMTETAGMTERAGMKDRSGMKECDSWEPLLEELARTLHNSGDSA